MRNQEPSQAINPNELEFYPRKRMSAPSGSDDEGKSFIQPQMSHVLPTSDVTHSESSFFIDILRAAGIVYAMLLIVLGNNRLIIGWAPVFDYLAATITLAYCIGPWVAGERRIFQSCAFFFIIMVMDTVVLVYTLIMALESALFYISRDLGH